MVAAALAPITLAIKTLYGIATSVQGAVQDINDFLDRHIAELKQSDNPTIASTGRVLEAAKFGFGLGYMSSIAIIATGQLILGNSLSAAGTVATGVTLTNPIAMTCAAIGAVYYGWDALSAKERAAILDRLSIGLEMGVELIKALVHFVVEKTREFLSSKQLAEFKKFVKTQAAQFGRSLYDITHAMGDLVKGAAEKASDFAGQTVNLTNTVARKTAGVAGDAAVKVVDSASEIAIAVTGKLRPQEDSLEPDFSPRALQRWASIPAKDRQQILRHVRCAQCGNAVSTKVLTGRIRRGDLILTGECPRCDGAVVRVVEGNAEDKASR